FWRLANSDLMALAGPQGRLLALHGLPPASAKSLQQTLVSPATGSRWWYDDGRLFWVFVQPITTGQAAYLRPWGSVAVGYEVNDRVAGDSSLFAASEITLFPAWGVIASTLPRGSWDKVDIHKLLAGPPGPREM